MRPIFARLREPQQLEAQLRMRFGQLMYKPAKVETGIDILEEGRKEKIYVDRIEKLGFAKILL